MAKVEYRLPEPAVEAVILTMTKKEADFLRGLIGGSTVPPAFEGGNEQMAIYDALVAAENNFNQNPRTKE